MRSASPASVVARGELAALLGGANRGRVRANEARFLCARRWHRTAGAPWPARSRLGASPNARDGVMSEPLLDAAGRRRSPATLPHFHAGRPPRNKGIRYPADPPTVEEIVAVMRHAGDRVHGRRLRALIVVLWRAGLRIQEALALAEADLDPRRGSLLVRRGKGGRRREVGMDDWAWEQFTPWLQVRVELPVGPLFCVRQRPHAWPALVGRRRPHRVAPRRPRGRCATALRAAPAAPRARRRNGARGRAADRHPTPARTHQTSASPPSTCKASTTPRSSTPSRPPRTDDPRRQVASRLIRAADRRAGAIPRPPVLVQRQPTAWLGGLRALLPAGDRSSVLLPRRMRVRARSRVAGREVTWIAALTRFCRS
jgi:integrase